MRSAFPLQEDLRWFVEQIWGGGGGGELEGRLKVEGGKPGREGGSEEGKELLFSLVDT